MVGRFFAARDAADPGTRNCPVCADPEHRIRRIGPLNATIPVQLEQLRYDLVQCGACGLIFLSPMPSERDVHAMYVEAVQFSDSVYTDASRVAAILEYMTSCLERMASRVGRKKTDPISILEVGAGLAWMCRCAKSLNAQSRTIAQDISPEAVGACPWVDSYVCSDVVDPALDRHAPYDVISLTHVVEHLVDPVAVIARCKRLLRENGIIFITAPHRPIGWRERAPDIALWQSYSYNHVPAHVQYFSKDSMTALAKRTRCSLDLWSAAAEDGQAFEAWLK